MREDATRAGHRRSLQKRKTRHPAFDCSSSWCFCPRWSLSPRLPNHPSELSDRASRHPTSSGMAFRKLLLFAVVLLAFPLSARALGFKTLSRRHALTISATPIGLAMPTPVHAIAASNRATPTQTPFELLALRRTDAGELHIRKKLKKYAAAAILGSGVMHQLDMIYRSYGLVPPSEAFSGRTSLGDRS